VASQLVPDSVLLQLRDLLPFPDAYDRVSRDDTEEVGDPDDPDGDPWNEGTLEDAAAVLELPCRFAPGGRGETTAEGTVVREEPRLWVPHDDPLDAGDVVQEVRNGLGDVLLSGPARVMHVAPIGHGLTLQKRATLAQAGPPS
jgi:hypothetical protein